MDWWTYLARLEATGFRLISCTDTSFHVERLGKEYWFFYEPWHVIRRDELREAR